MNAGNDNPYLVMPLPQVKADARNGVRLAVEAWRQCDSEAAAKELGRIIEPPTRKIESTHE